MAVYFVQAGDGPVKIGVANDVNKRLVDLQVGNAEPLTVRAVMRGGVEQERKLHFAFRHLRIRGEWFRLDEELEELIAELVRRAT